MSMKKAGITIFSLIIMIIIILLTVRGCSITKKAEENSVQKESPEVVLQGENNTTEKETSKDDDVKNKVESDEKSTSNSSNTGVEKDKTSSVGTAEEKVEPSTNSENAEVGNIDTNNIGSADLFMEVDEPSLGSSSTIDALVSGKKSYLVENKSYAYSISIIIPNEGKYNIVDYYCPKKTYDAVSTGESIKVEYQLDDSGNISISSISK